jgi:polyphosphate glucokinase
MVDGVKKLSTGWKFDSITIGLPAPIRNNKPVKNPANLGPGWMDFDYDADFGVPVKIINDAAMQAVGSYKAGRMLFLGLGTGLGSCLIVDHSIVPLELAHMPYRKGKTFEDYVGLRGLKKLGKKRWRKQVSDVCDILYAALLPCRRQRQRLRGRLPPVAEGLGERGAGVRRQAEEVSGRPARRHYLTGTGRSSAATD